MQAHKNVNKTPKSILSRMRIQDNKERSKQRVSTRTPRKLESAIDLL